MSTVTHHIRNQAAAERWSFRRPEDYQRFESLLADGRRLFGIKLFAYSLLPSHWQLVVKAHNGDELEAFLRWLVFRHGGRYWQPPQVQSYELIAISTADQFRRVCRHVEGNALTAQLVQRAEQWRWSSLWVRAQGPEAYRRILLDPWPDGQPEGWAESVNQPISMAEREYAARRGISVQFEQTN